MNRRLHCRTPQCGIRLYQDEIIPLCASCRSIGRLAFACGSALTGAGYVGVTMLWEWWVR
jgi:hypothetical protein